LLSRVDAVVVCGREGMMRFLVVVGVAAAMLTACGGDGDETEPPVSSASTLPPAATTTAAEAMDGPVTLVVTYDGETCTSVGPDAATLDDEITLTFLNSSEEVVWVSLKLMPPDRVDELDPLVGTGFEYSEETFLRPLVILQPPAGSEQTSSTFLAVDGIYIVDCIRFVDGFRSYTWWPASLEVTS
jgi:hypothetical protein